MRKTPCFDPRVTFYGTPPNPDELLEWPQTGTIQHKKAGGRKLSPKNPESDVLRHRFSCSVFSGQAKNAQNAEY